MKENQRSIRFTAEQMAGLEKLAAAYSVDVATVVRWAVDALIGHVERHGGRLHLPIDFDEIWQLRSSHEKLAAEDPDRYNKGRKKKTS